jgi:hypothetical protein
MSREPANASCVRAGLYLAGLLLALATLAFATTGSASATVLCKTATDPCSGGTYGKGTTIEASLKAGTSWRLPAGFATPECEEAALKGEVTDPGGEESASISGPLTSLSFGECNMTVTVLKKGNFSVSSTSGGNGTLALEGFEITFFNGVTSCTYGGSASMSLSGGAMASLKTSGSLTKVAGSFLCANPAVWSAEYTVASPEPLYVADSGYPVLCKTASDPCVGGVYGKGSVIEASLKAGTKSVLKAGFANPECEEEAIKGEVTNAGGKGTNVSGAVTSLTFGKCNMTVAILKKGSFSIKSTSGGNGTVTLEGFEVTFSNGGASCTYGGSISASLSGGAMASISTNASVTRLAGGFLCANPATWTADFTVTAPEPLYVANNEGAVLCKTATGCADDVYGKGTAIEAALKSGVSSVLKANFATISCEETAIKGEVTNPGAPGEGIGGPITSFSFGKCGAATVEVLKKGSFTIDSPSGGNGLLALEGFEIKVASGGTSCTYGGPILASLSGGTMASIGTTDSVPKLAGGVTCANPAVWTAEYTITAPEPLYLASS